MRPLIAASAAAVLLSVTAASPAGAVSGHNCRSPGSAYGHIRATKVSCATAYKVIRADTSGRRYPGWFCVSRPYPGGANVSCRHRGGERVAFQVAD